MDRTMETSIDILFKIVVRVILKKADELCSKIMICVTLIFLEFSSAFFSITKGDFDKG
jgi:hypothetical protein